MDSGDAGVYYVEITDSVDGGKVSNSNDATVAIFPPWNGLVSHEAFDITGGYAPGELPLQNPAIPGCTGAWTDINFGECRTGGDGRLAELRGPALPGFQR